MVVAHTQAESRVAGKSAIGGDYGDRRGLEWIVCGEPKNSVVLAIFIRCIWRARDNVVPLQDIFVVGFCHDIRRRICTDRFILLI